MKVADAMIPDHPHSYGRLRIYYFDTLVKWYFWGTKIIRFSVLNTVSPLLGKSCSTHLVSSGFKQNPNTNYLFFLHNSLSSSFECSCQMNWIILIYLPGSHPTIIILSILFPRKELAFPLHSIYLNLNCWDVHVKKISDKTKK